MTVVYPPYYASWGEQSDSHAGDADFLTYIYGDAGVNGNITSENRNRIWFPGNSASQVTRTSSNIQFYFQSPVSGLLRIVATVIVGNEYGDPSFEGFLFPELTWPWGTGASISQKSTLDMWIPGVIDGNFARYPLVDYIRKDHTGPWGPYPVGDHYESRQYQYVPNITFTAGDWVLMQLAVWNEQHAWVNDIIFRGVINSYYYVGSLDVTGV